MSGGCLHRRCKALPAAALGGCCGGASPRLSSGSSVEARVVFTLYRNGWAGTPSKRRAVMVYVGL